MVELDVSIPNMLDGCQELGPTGLDTRLLLGPLWYRERKVATARYSAELCVYLRHVCYIVTFCEAVMVTMFRIECFETLLQTFCVRASRTCHCLLRTFF